ncbi:MAG: hypothetical protein QM767_07555 [Anaeromyxobacter sp.]
MADNELDVTPVEGEHRIPVGWALLFWGLIAFGGFYVYAYSPWGGGWSQSQDASDGGASNGANLVATLAFTVIPATVALVLIAAQRRKKG